METGRPADTPERVIRWLRRALTDAPQAEDRLSILTGLAILHTDAAEREGDVADLWEAVRWSTEAADVVPADHRHAAITHLRLSSAYGNLLAVLGSRDAAIGAADAARRAYRLIRDDDAHRVDLLDAVMVQLTEAGAHLHREDLLDEAIEVGLSAITAGGTGLYNLGTAYRLRFEVAGDVGDLVDAERFLTGAVELDEPHGRATAAQFSELAHVLGLRHKVGGSADYALRAAEAWRRSLELGEPGDGEDRARRASFAGALVDLWRVDPSSDVTEALTQVRMSMLPGDDEPDYATCYTAAAALTDWAEYRQDTTLLEEAEAAARAAVAASGDEAESADAHDLLARVLQGRFGLGGDVSLLDEAIALGTLAAESSEGAQDDHAGRLGNLGISLLDRFLALSDPQDLDLAVDADRRAVAALPDGHHDFARYRNNLGVALCHRFQLTGNPRDLEEAVRFGREALAGDETGPDRAQHLSNLGNALYHRHARFGNLDDLDEDVDLLREAIRCVRAGHPFFPGLLSNLATALRLRYSRLDTADDLEEAVAALRDALAEDLRTRDRRTIVDAYATALHTMGESTGDRLWHRQAVEQLSSVVVLEQDRDPDLPRRLSNLLSMLSGGTEVDPATVDATITAGELVVSTLPGDHPHLSGLLTNLAHALRGRGGAGDLDRAVHHAESALQHSPEVHPDRAENLVNLAAFLHSRFRRLGHPHDLSRAVSSLREAATSDPSAPDVRLRAASSWASLEVERGDTITAASAMGLAVEALPLVSPQRLNRTDAQRRLADLAGLAPDAAALCLENAQVERAVALLELGRGVLLNRTLHIRDDTAALRGADDHLAAAFERLRDQLDHLDLQDAISVDVHPLPERSVDARARSAAGRHREHRRTIVREFTEVVERIRALPGHAGFLRPPPFAELLEAAADGPVAVINVSRWRSDAIVLTIDGARVVRLDNLVADEMRQRAARFHHDVVEAGDYTTTAAEREAAEERVATALDWLWRVVTKPVLDALPEDTEVVWWVPTGAAALLPLHAATAADGSGSVLDRITSSYAPTVTALRHARRRLTSHRTAAPVVVISTHTDERTRVLRSAIDEAHDVAVGYGVKVLDAAVLDKPFLVQRIGTASDLHVALHAISDATDPSRSRLRLGTHSLSMSEIAALRVEGAGLAYLSACETTLTTVALADEAIHLTAAFQLAGFPHVVGTLWRIPDAVAAHASRRFYSVLRQSGRTTVSAAHEAALYLRERYRESPATWAAYHHAGA
ncbi:CHAT domain-containing protein [Actinosynnema sp. NPDC050801]|uniref:CHAT domain-containing tetratricopeptide repeat protein n=1 Tax=unclassified Actinosynnema TaxID=2637065 RepID=UPI0033C80C0C